MTLGGIRPWKTRPPTGPIASDKKKVVQVIRLYAEDSVEERILELQNRKRALIDQLISSGDGAGGLDLEDLRHLFS